MRRPRYFIADFPQDGNVWQLARVGAVFRHESEPSIMLVEVYFRLFEWVGKKVPLDAQAHEIPQTIRCLVSVGIFPILCVGGLWQDGIQLDVDGGLRYTVDFATIPIENTELLGPMSNNAVALTEYLPPDEFFFPEASKIRFVAVQVPLEDRIDTEISILLPCHELLRFYFACSSDLANAVFSGDPARLDEIRSLATISGPEGRTVVAVNLKGKFEDTDAVVVARIAGSPVAWASLQKTLGSILTKDATGKAYPIALFPFRGRTRMNVVGRFVTSRSGRRSLVVDRIMDCSGRMPFQILRLLERTPKSHGRGPGEDGTVSRVVRRPEIEVAGPIPVQSQRPSNSRIGPTQIKTNPSRFTAMAMTILQVQELPASDQGQEILGVLTTTEKIAELSGAEGYGGDNVGKAKFVQKPREDIKKRKSNAPVSEHLEHFECVLEKLEENFPVRVRFRQPHDSQDFSVPPLSASRRGDWHYLDPETRQTVRRLLVVDIETSEATATLMEFERRSNEESASIPVFLPLSGDPLTDSQVRHFVGRLRRKYGSWPLTERLNSPEGVVGLARLNHELAASLLESAERYFVAITELIIRVRGEVSD